eukprot:scaffold298885_cov27-Tisochrysis_lutea.AAC.2
MGSASASVKRVIDVTDKEVHLDPRLKFLAFSPRTRLQHITHSRIGSANRFRFASRAPACRFFMLEVNSESSVHIEKETLEKAG